MRLTRQSFKDRSGKTQQTKKWYVELTDHREKVQRIPAFTDRKASAEFGRKIERLVSLRAADETPDAAMRRWLEGLPKTTRDRLLRIGLVSAASVGAAAPLKKHIDDFEQYLSDKGNTAEHAGKSASRVRKIINGIGANYPSELRASAVQRYLAQRQAEGLGRASANHYLTAVKGFGRWMVRERRLSENPVGHLSRCNAKPDIRRKRRALTPDELRTLIQTTEAGPERNGLTGQERSLLYRLACETGLRAGELRSLTRASFDLSEPCVTIQAAYAKSRRTDTQPLRKDTAEALETALAGKLPGAQVFKLPMRTAEMLEEDLKDAGIPVTDAAGRVVDFHGLRHTFISNLAAGGVHPKKAQELARHSTIGLTMDCYTHTARGELSACLDVLPDVSTIVAETARATGTNDADSVPNKPATATKNVLPDSLPDKGSNSCNSVQSSATNGTVRDVCLAQKTGEKPGENSDSEPSTQMGVAGLEPALPFEKGILNPLRLPFRHTPVRVAPNTAPGGGPSVGGGIITVSIRRGDYEIRWSLGTGDMVVRIRASNWYTHAPAPSLYASRQLMIDEILNRVGIGGFTRSLESLTHRIAWEGVTVVAHTVAVGVCIFIGIDRKGVELVWHAVAIPINRCQI